MNNTPHTSPAAVAQHELRDHLAYIMRHWMFIIVITIGAAVVAYFVSENRPDSYQVVQNYEIQQVNRGASGEYEFGSFYDQQGSQFFVQHVMSLLRSAPVITEIYEEAGVPVEINNYNRFTNQYRADQLSSQHFSVTFSQFNQGTAQDMAEAMNSVLAERVATAELNADGEPRFALRSNTPTIVYKESPVVLATVVAAVAGFLLSIILVYVKRYILADN